MKHEYSFIGGLMHDVVILSFIFVGVACLIMMHATIIRSKEREVRSEQYTRCFTWLTNEFHGYDIADNRCDHIVHNVPLI